MKNSTAFLYLIGISLGFFGINKVGYAQQDTTDFVTTWKTDNPGFTNDSSVSISIDGTYTFNYDIDWNNDGIFDTLGVTTSIMHHFPAAGTHTIRIRGQFPALRFGHWYYNNFQGDADKLLSVDQWGDQQWKSMREGFVLCQNLSIPAMDAPNLDSLSSLEALFLACSNFNSNINHWDVSSISNFKSLFLEAHSFNQPLDNWDVGSANFMNSMFKNAFVFNQDLSAWNVSNLWEGNSMFSNARRFNQDISGWNTSQLINAENMFFNARQFNQDISQWDMGNVVNMSQMFSNAYQFNQNLGDWNIQAVRFFPPFPVYSFGMAGIFDHTAMSLENYDSTIIAWEAKPHRPNLQFGAAGLNYCLSEVARDSLIADGWIFSGDTLNCNPDDFVTTWKTDNPISSLSPGPANTIGNDSSIYINIDNNYSYNYDVDWDNDGIFDTLGVTGPILHQYAAPGIYTIRIRGVFPSIKFGKGTFDFGIPPINYPNNQDKLIAINQWGNQKWKDLHSAFALCFNLTTLGNDAPVLDSTNSLKYAFFGAVLMNSAMNHWDVSKISDFKHTFRAAITFNHPLDNWDVSSAVDMSYMFLNANDFNQALNSWDVSSVTMMSGMFGSDSSFDQNLSNWDVSSVTTMNSMFGGATAFNQPLNTWDVSNVTDMSQMFLGASTFNQPLNNWDVSSVTNVVGLFRDASSFNQALNNWDVSIVSDMRDVFSRATSFNQDVGNWDVSSVTDFRGLFTGASNFNQNLGAWHLSSVQIMTDMLTNTNLSIENYDSTLIGWEGKTHPSNITLGAQGLEYCLGKAARDSLIADGWTFVGDSKDSTCVISSIEDVVESKTAEFKLYPNPTRGITNLEITNVESNQVLQIYNQMGQMIREVRIQEGKNQIDLSGFRSGLYFIRYGNESKKLIIRD